MRTPILALAGAVALWSGCSCQVGGTGAACTTSNGIPAVVCNGHPCD